MVGLAMTISPQIFSWAAFLLTLGAIAWPIARPTNAPNFRQERAADCSPRLLSVEPGPWNGRAGLLGARSVGRLQVCAPGTLSLDVRTAAASSTVLLVSQHGRSLLQQSVGAARTIRIPIHTAGLVTITAPNGAYRVEDRNLRIDNLTFETLCHTAPARLGPGANARWNGRSGALYGNAVLILEPCAAGRLTILAHGDLAEGRGPVIEVLSEQSLLLREEVRSQRTYTISIPSRRRVTIRYANELFAAINDRQLLIQGWRYDEK